jgi:hypothetical protein
MGWIVKYVTIDGKHKVYSGQVHQFQHQAQEEADHRRLSFVTKVYVARAN